MKQSQISIDYLALVHVDLINKTSFMAFGLLIDSCLTANNTTSPYFHTTKMYSETFDN